MKKMPYAVIFIIILAILIFAGCKTMIESPSEDGTSDESISETEETQSTVDLDIDLDIEDLTDEDGETIFSEDEISSMKEEYSSLAEEISSSLAEEEKTSGQSASGDTTASSNSTESTTRTQAAESTTRSNSSEPTTSTRQETTTSAPVSNVSEYDVLRSGHFYLDGTMYADGESNPITLAVGDDLVYMQTTMDGATMGFLISEGSTYLLNPSEKTYCEFGSVLSGILAQAGMMSQEEIMQYINEMGFSAMEDLDKANESSNATLNGKACKVYIFNKSDGSKTRVFMDGKKLLGFEIVASNGIVDTATYINTISSDIPTLPPSDYSKQNIISFMTSMESVLGE